MNCFLKREVEVFLMIHDFSDLLLNLSYCLNFIIPKKNNKVIFYSSPDYSDNARALYEELVREELDKEFDVVWVVKAFDKYNKQLNNVKVVKHRTLRSLWHFCTSKYIVRTHSLWGNQYVQGKQVMCIAWHGMPLKKLVSPSGERTMVKCDILTSTSLFFDKELSEAMGLSQNVCKHVGLPRNDELFRGGNDLEIMYPDFTKRIIWMPTFRNSMSGYTDGLETELGIPCVNRLQLEQLNEVLKSLNYLLILKLHPWSAEKLTGIHYSNIVNLKDSDINEQVSLYKLLGQTDALITDYSSVYVDYLLINKPICFVYDDLEEYRKTRGFWCEPIESYMPGAKVNDFEGLVKWFNSFETIDSFVKEREHLKKVFFLYPDGNSSKRTLQELLKH